MKVDLSLSQFLGNSSNGWKAEIGLQHVLFPEWRFSPFLTLGTGYVETSPRATIVLPLDRAGSDGVRRRRRPFLSHQALFPSRRLSLAHDLHEPR